MSFDQLHHQINIADIPVLKRDILRNQLFSAGGQIVEDNHGPIQIAKRQHRVAPYIASPSRNENDWLARAGHGFG